MSLRVKSHTDLQAAGRTSLDDSLYKSLSVSSSNISKGARFGNGTTVEVKGLSRTLRRPVRAVRPVTTFTSGGSFLQINHLQGELVRKRKVRGRRGLDQTFIDSVLMDLKKPLKVLSLICFCAHKSMANIDYYSIDCPKEVMDCSFFNGRPDAGSIYVNMTSSVSRHKVPAEHQQAHQSVGGFYRSQQLLVWWAQLLLGSSQTNLQP